MTLLITLFILILAAISWLDLGLAIGVALLGVLLTAGVLGAKFAGVIKEVRQALDKLRDVRDADSPGGRQITDQERKELVAEAVDVLEEIWKQYSGGILKRIGSIFRRE